MAEQPRHDQLRRKEASKCSDTRTCPKSHFWYRQGGYLLAVLEAAKAERSCSLNLAQFVL